MTSPPLITVCIPAYNRANVLPPLLDSIITQDFSNFEILICEDNSPERDAIHSITLGYVKNTSVSIRYHENEKNLGYDGNLRNLIERAEGEYCLFMGNDDLMCPNTLAKVADALTRHNNIGVVLRTYAAFDGTPDNIVQTFRYFDKEIFFPAGSNTIITMYRRSVVIPGMVIHRNAARKWASNKFDGTLLYQLYLVANILADMNAVYIPDVTVLYRNGGTPDFGNSEAEQGKFTPTAQTPESSVNFMEGMLTIAQSIEKERNLPIYSGIRQDIDNYAYPILAIQGRLPFFSYVKYLQQLVKVGMGRNPMFYAWAAIILTLGTKHSEQAIKWIKTKLGHTPRLGKIYQGNK
jgi:glycosyltransferase involved in cell wall biosynthesis